MLADPTVERLRLRAAASTSRFVFPAITDAARPIRSDGVVLRLAKARAKIGVSEGFTSHTIRHTCLAWLAESGCPREVRDRISNHAPASSGGVDHIYNSAELNRPAREWIRRWGDFISSLEAKNEVVSENVGAADETLVHSQPHCGH